VSPPPLEVDLSVVLIVSLNDHLDQLMADDVAFIELDERYSFDAAHNTLRFDQARLASGWQVNLRHITRDHGLRSEADARQKHRHLFRGRVLRLVEYDERIRERAPAHERQRRDFDHTLLKKLRHPFEIHQVKERVVKRAQVRINFVLQITGQKAE